MRNTWASTHREPPIPPGVLDGSPIACGAERRDPGARKRTLPEPFVTPACMSLQRWHVDQLGAVYLLGTVGAVRFGSGRSLDRFVLL
jgi:hypothetical protein